MIPTYFYLGDDIMLEEIAMSKFLFLMKGIGIVCPIISLIFWFMIMSTCLREDGAEGWKIDFYNISIYENNMIKFIVIVCLLSLFSLLNPYFSYCAFPLEKIYETFAGQYGYLFMFNVNSIIYRLLDIFQLTTLLVLCKSIVSEKISRFDRGDAARLHRDKFINVSVVIIFCLVVEVSLYLLIPSNEFIIHNIAGMDLEL
jgi:hypothetical protein